MKNVLVFGGNGFLGTALIQTLIEDGVQNITSFDLSPSPIQGVRSIVADLCDPEQVIQACEGMDTVFQTAALVDWGPRSRERLFAVNVQGNRNVVSGCIEQGVQRLIYTSSIDVVFDGTAIQNGDEQLPYPTRHLDDYGHTKALAEQEVLQANRPQGLQTCALRAAGIYGPGDRHRFPPILKVARQGKMVHLGDGRSRFNHIYIANLVSAHLQAAKALMPGSAVSGQAYFITDHAPTNFYDFFTPYLEALGLSIPTSRISTSVAYTLALIMESLARIGIGPQPPLLTRYVVLSTCRDFYFTSEKARRDFGYAPVVPFDQAFQETLARLKENVT